MVHVVGVFVGDYLWRVEYAAELIRKGCSPTAFDRNGIPTKWRCPAAVIRQDGSHFYSPSFLFMVNSIEIFRYNRIAWTNFSFSSRKISPSLIALGTQLIIDPVEQPVTTPV